MAKTLETSRLLLRSWTDADVALLARLAADPAVVRYIGDGQCWSAERVDEVAGMMTEHWRVNDFGWRVVVQKESHEPVGLAMLNYLGHGTVGLDPEEFEIGWWVFPGTWRQGLASEAARAICEESFERCQGSRELPTCDHGFSPPVIAGRSARIASRWARIR